MVSEPGQEKLRRVYLEFCETWLSLLFPGGGKGSVYLGMNATPRRRLHTASNVV